MKKETITTFVKEFCKAYAFAFAVTGTATIASKAITEYHERRKPSRDFNKKLKKASKLASMVESYQSLKATSSDLLASISDELKKEKRYINTNASFFVADDLLAAINAAEDAIENFNLETGDINNVIEKVLDYYKQKQIAIEDEEIVEKDLDDGDDESDEFDYEDDFWDDEDDNPEEKDGTNSEEENPSENDK